MSRTTSDRCGLLVCARRVGGDVEQMLNAPFLLVGTVDEICEQLIEARARWDFSYFVTHSPEQRASIIEALCSTDLASVS